MEYQDFEIEITDATTRSENGQRIGRHSVRVIRSPQGEMRPDQATPVEYDDKELQRGLDRLERRELDAQGLLALGRRLAALLLPLSPQPAAGPGVRELFAACQAALGPDRGLRLRLRLPPGLTVLPWEFAFVERAGGEGMDGFLALDPRVAIVRHETLAAPVDSPVLEGDIRVVAALAAPGDLPELDLESESSAIAAALQGLEGLRLECCEHATLAKLGPLLAGAGVFHFAGHGEFDRQMGERPGSYVGTGALAFEDRRIGAEQLGINLRGQGVRLAVLGGCQTGRRDGFSVWSGVAPALVKVGIPAVLAHQYSIKDGCAIAFSRAFYEALAAGLPLETAVAAGRIAVYNADPGGRDWGVPVLYLRAGDGRLFAGGASQSARDRARASAEGSVSLRAAQIRAGAVVVGQKVREMLQGLLEVRIRVAGPVAGTLTGAEIGALEGGSAHAVLDLGEVGAGATVTGMDIGVLGAEPPPASARAAAPATTTSTVTTGAVSGGTVIGTQHNALGGTVNVENLTIVQGGAAPAAPDPDANAIEERLRLDVALPSAVVVDEPFDLVIAVRQPESPVLAVADLDQVVSAGGSVFRSEADQVLRYRIEVAGAGFQVTPPSYVLKLRPHEDSAPVAFQVVASRPGRRSLFVTAFQEDGALAAQTRLSITVGVAVQPG